MGTISTSSLREGSVFEFGNKKYVVLKYQHIKKGRGQAINRVKIKDLESGVITEKTFTNEQTVEEADVQKRSAQYLYLEKGRVYFMDTSDYSQYDLPKEEIEDQLNFLTDGMKVITLYIDDRPVSIELPKSVELKIVQTEPAVAGNTAQNAMKNAELETGLVINVPLFLKVNDCVKINTQTGEYIGRVR